MIQQSHFWVYIQKKLIIILKSTPMFTVALFTIAKTQKQMSINGYGIYT